MLEPRRLYPTRIVVAVDLPSQTMATIAMFCSYQKKKLTFQAWRNYADNLQKEAYRSELEKYQTDPRYANVETTVSKMRKPELVETARKECDLTQIQAEKLTVPMLRGLIKLKRDGEKLEIDPMMVRPKGLSNMKKDALIAEAKKRGLTVDGINPRKKEWIQLTREEIMLMIGEHVEYLNGRETAILNKETPANSSATMNESSSDAEFMDVRVEEALPSKQTGSRRKRETKSSRAR